MPETPTAVAAEKISEPTPCVGGPAANKAVLQDVHVQSLLGAGVGQTVEHFWKNKTKCKHEFIVVVAS